MDYMTAYYLWTVFFVRHFGHLSHSFIKTRRNNVC